MSWCNIRQFLWRPKVPSLVDGDDDADDLGKDMWYVLPHGRGVSPNRTLVHHPAHLIIIMMKFNLIWWSIWWRWWWWLMTRPHVQRRQRGRHRAAALQRCTPVKKLNTRQKIAHLQKNCTYVPTKIFIIQHSPFLSLHTINYRFHHL